MFMTAAALQTKPRRRPAQQLCAHRGPAPGHLPFARRLPRAITLPEAAGRLRFACVSPAKDSPAMIPRYSRPEMVRIWEPENKFRIWFEIEAHACDAQAELGVIPKEAAKAVWERGAFDPALALAAAAPGLAVLHQ